MSTYYRMEQCNLETESKRAPLNSSHQLLTPTSPPPPAFSVLVYIPRKLSSHSTHKAISDNPTINFYNDKRFGVVDTGLVKLSGIEQQAMWK
jgi:hypothetical protein